MLDSRGNPTVEAEVYLKSGARARAIVPSGASTGTGEALELRDNDPHRYGGKGVMKAVWNINNKIADVITDNSADIATVDEMLRELDGTKDKSNLGANAILAVSLANAKANAVARRLPFYQYIAELAGTKMSLPMPMMNVINGGAHAGWATDFQEYMIIPRSSTTITDAVRMGSEVFHTLKIVLKEHGYPTTVGDEGGYAPKFYGGNNEPLECIKLAVKRAGYDFGKDIAVALDVAASEFYHADEIHASHAEAPGHYELNSDHAKKSADEMISWYEQLTATYPIVSIEDGLAENDWASWHDLTDRLGGRVQLVGDDLFVTNTELLKRGIDEHTANAILIKPNQIGTLTETIAAVKMAHDAGYKTIMSHRSGETEDVTIAHLAVGLGTGQIKAGSLSRSERIAKYNELVRIADTNDKLQLAHPFVD